MNNSDTHNMIMKIEDSVDVNSLSYEGFNTWPLLRKIIFLELRSTIKENKNNKKEYLINFFQRIKSILSVSLGSLKKTETIRDVEKIFFSRPPYLQETDSNNFVDRIIDPIIGSFDKDIKTVKYYLTKISKEKKLLYNYFYLYESISFKFITLTDEEKRILNEISSITKINSLKLQNRYKSQLREFIRWYFSAKKLISKCPQLKEIYIVCWYFTDTMGICAAASEAGITTIDVQHGKQGKYQSMYSGWQKIPETGYNIMPDKFWCWGKPSCDHILSCSSSRKKHKPFIGGFPWVEYYKKYLTSDSCQSKESKITILLTTQPPTSGNNERIPNFIIDFLCSYRNEDLHLIIRLHPNDNKGYHYCLERLRMIDKRLYSIDKGKVNLYDIFRKVTHHITAYSSCCYEASLFNIPTMLYGEESREIYNEEISNNVFSWTNYNKDDIFNWVNSDVHSYSKSSFVYIDNESDDQII